MITRVRTFIVLCGLSWVSFGADTFGDLVPQGVCGGETPQFDARYAQAGSPSEFKPAYLQAGIQDVPGGGLSAGSVEPLKDLSVPSFGEDKTLLALNLPEAGFPSSLFVYNVGNCQDKWANDFFCDKPFCQCPYKYGEWIVTLRDPSEGAAFKNYAKDKRDYIQSVYNAVRENPAYGTSGKWSLVSVSVYRTAEPKVFARFNYKSLASKEQFMSVSVPIKEGAESDSGLVAWMCAIMGKFCAKCSASSAAAAQATTTPTPTTTTLNPAVTAPVIAAGQTKIVFSAVDVLKYKGQCRTSPMAGAAANQLMEKKKRFDTTTHARASCKAECMTENTDGTFAGGQTLHPNGGGSSCRGFAWNPTVAAPTENCILYQERNIDPLPAGVTTPAPNTPEGQWECFDLQVTKTFEHERAELAHGTFAKKSNFNNLHEAAIHEGDAKYFKPALSLVGGFKARRFKVRALQPGAAAAYFSPYMWVEFEDGKVDRRLAGAKVDSNFWWRQIMTGSIGFIPVSTAEYQQLIACVPISGAEMTPAHVVTTDRICVDATTEGYCIQQTLELTWLWPLIAGMLLCFLIGYFCKRTDHAQNFEVIVRDKTGAPVSGVHAAGGGSDYLTTFHIGH